MLSSGLAFLAGGVIGAELRIRSVDEFIQFKDNVNGGTDYYGTTVFLDSDLSLAGESFEPIGDYSNYFSGVFNGQGHVISNFKMNSSSQDVGLFGYSTGLTIKNVILDSSCSFTNTFSYSFGDASIGGIIGICSGPCTIENSVNMGSVSFSGSTGDILSLGGITGWLSSSDYNAIVKNCANYGDVTDSGESGNTYIGGIVGDSQGSSSTKSVYIYNSLNHGTITYNGASSSALYLGGISGWTSSTNIENCVSGGKISSTTSFHIGSIIGSISSETVIDYTYFTSDLSDYNKYGSGTPSNESNTLSYSTSFELSGTVSIGDYSGTSLIEALNAGSVYYKDRGYSQWLLNKGKNAVTFAINGNSSFTLNTQVILLPSLASEEGMSFDGWYEDKDCKKLLKRSTVEEVITLYGKYESDKSIAPSLFPHATLLLSFLISLVAF